MTTPASKLPAPNEHASFGFMSVIELPTLGHCGGLLTVSSIGRPIEFHCTSPVPVNRSQQIMYGQTYRGFLFCEQIGAALIDKVKQTPNFLLTYQPDLLPIGEIVDWPILLVEPKSTEAPFDGSGLQTFETENQRCWCVNLEQASVELARTHACRFAEKLPFDEPFERIAQAIEEAHAVIRAA